MGILNLAKVHVFTFHILQIWIKFQEIVSHGFLIILISLLLLEFQDLIPLLRIQLTQDPHWTFPIPPQWQHKVIVKPEMATGWVSQGWFLWNYETSVNQITILSWIFHSWRSLSRGWGLIMVEFWLLAVRRKFLKIFTVSNWKSY